MLFNWLRRKHPDQDLSELQKALQTALGDRLKTLLVFGSMASGEYRASRSNVNVLIIVDMSMDALRAMGPALKKWLSKGHIAPVIVEKDGLDEFAQDFPIEFLDMREEHKILYGENPLLGLKVDQKHLKSQCEHDLALVQLRLRQAIAVAEGKRAALLSALTRTLPSVLTLFRAAIRLEENAPKLDKIRAVEQLAKKAGFNPESIHRLKDSKIHRESDNLNDLAQQYLDAITAVLNYLRK